MELAPGTYLLSRRSDMLNSAQVIMKLSDRLDQADIPLEAKRILMSKFPSVVERVELLNQPDNFLVQMTRTIISEIMTPVERNIKC